MQHKSAHKKSLNWLWLYHNANTDTHATTTLTRTSHTKATTQQLKAFAESHQDNSLHTNTQHEVDEQVWLQLPCRITRDKLWFFQVGFTSPCRRRRASHLLPNEVGDVRDFGGWGTVSWFHWNLTMERNVVLEICGFTSLFPFGHSCDVTLLAVGNAVEDVGNAVEDVGNAVEDEGPPFSQNAEEVEAPPCKRWLKLPRDKDSTLHIYTTVRFPLLESK